MTSERATGADRSVRAKTSSAQNYRVHGVSRPGGHGKIRCNTTDIKADTGSISDGFRPGPADVLGAFLGPPSGLCSEGHRTLSGVRSQCLIARPSRGWQARRTGNAVT